MHAKAGRGGVSHKEPLISHIRSGYSLVPPGRVTQGWSHLVPVMQRGSVGPLPESAQLKWWLHLARKRTRPTGKGKGGDGCEGLHQLRQFHRYERSSLTNTLLMHHCVADKAMSREC
jgi:hypothetical protein